MKEKKSGLYLEFFNPVLAYYQQLTKRERHFECGIPFFIALVCTLSYCHFDLLHKALAVLTPVLLDLTAILIGLSVLLITILLTANGAAIDRLHEYITGRQITGTKDKLTLYQVFHIHFTYSVISESFLLLLLLFYSFLDGFTNNAIVCWIFLFLFTFSILHILFSIIRGVTNLYLSFFKSNS